MFKTPSDYNYNLMTGHTYKTDHSYLGTHDTNDLSLKQTIDRLKTKYIKIVFSIAKRNVKFRLH